MIYVIRHGQTDFNKEGRLQGRRGLPLNETGLTQAERLREELRPVSFDLAFSSPQGRAVQTAELVSGQKAVVLDDRIDVFDLGEADGLRREEVTMAGPIPDPGRYTGVEDTGRFVKRVFQFMSELEAQYAKQGLTIMIVGHRCTTGCIGAYFCGMPDDGNVLKYASGNGDYRVYQF